MRGDLRDLFARPVTRVVLVATACGGAALQAIRSVIHGFVIVPFAYSADLGRQVFDLFTITGSYSTVPATIAGRDVDWLDPMSAAVVLVLVIAATMLILRVTRRHVAQSSMPSRDLRSVSPSSSSPRQSYRESSFFLSRRAATTTRHGQRSALRSTVASSPCSECSRVCWCSPSSPRSHSGRIDAGSGTCLTP